MMNDRNNIGYIITCLSGVLLLFYFFKLSPWVAPVVFVGCAIYLIYRHFAKNNADEAVNKASEKKLQDLSQKNILRYSAWIKDNVRGHNSIIDQMLAQIQQNLSLVHENRTLGAFFLVGPTGTGKTFTAELIAQALFPQSKPIILRMNQYKLPSDVMTLLGPPPGHSGYEIGGTLTRPVLEDPCRVIILDEIDKCHKDVLDCFYNILDSAQCVEKSSGKVVSFSRCLIFATSNAAVDQLREIDISGKNHAYVHSKYREVLSDHSEMEKAFLARWSGVFFLDTLNPVNVAEVACLQIRKYWKQFGMEVVYTSPELLVQTVRSNAEFREFGVRQLANYIKMSTDSSISQAKQRGFQKVYLDIDKKTQTIIVKAA